MSPDARDERSKYCEECLKERRLPVPRTFFTKIFRNNDATQIKRKGKLTAAFVAMSSRKIQSALSVTITTIFGEQRLSLSTSPTHLLLSSRPVRRTCQSLIPRRRFLSNGNQYSFFRGSVQGTVLANVPLYITYVFCGMRSERRVLFS